jgi:hypothetical protein
MCGGKVAPIEKETARPRKPKSSTGKPKYRRWDRLGRRTDAKEDGQLEQIRSDAFDTLKQESVARLFFANILTFELRSVFWMMHRQPALDAMAMRGEKSRKSAIYIWFMAYVVAFLLALASGRELFMSKMDFIALAASRMPQAATAALVVAFVTGRHSLFWAREVIADAIENDRDETVRTKADTFAPSPFLLWFFGTTYLQIYINEITRARSLASFKNSKRPRSD